MINIVAFRRFSCNSVLTEFVGIAAAEFGLTNQQRENDVAMGQYAAPGPQNIDGDSREFVSICKDR